jgi:hypothetical protein
MFENQYRGYVLSNAYMRRLARQGVELGSYFGLILLCHELGCLRGGFGRVLQGHRGALLTRATIRRRRRVAIELGM